MVYRGSRARSLLLASLVFDWCASRRLPIAFVLAGGYLGPGLREEDIVELHRLTVSAAVGGDGAFLPAL